jgi:hypothetical protein
MSLMLFAAASAAVAAAPADEAPGQVNLTKSIGGYVYFNRPGADIGTHDTEVVDCIRQAARTVQPDVNGGGILGAILHSAMEDRGEAVNVENCMVVRGWRVVRISDEEGDRLAKLTPAEKSSELSAWVGEATPHGEIMRVWNNDAGRVSTKKFKLPGYFGRTSISVAAQPEQVRKEAATPPAPPELPKAAKSTRPPKALKPEQLAAVPADSALVIVHLKGLSMSNGQWMVLQRVGADPEIPAWAEDQRPDVVNVIYASFWTGDDGKILAYALPPGRWRVAGQGGGLSQLNFCLGAPAFEVAAGEVVYAGSFDMGAEDFGPNLDLGRAQALLAANPDQAARLRPAVYENGWTTACGGNFIYAYEIKGAPFRAGYVGGGAPAAAANQPAATPASSGR